MHYDSAYKILNNEYPIRDYWIVSGLSVDFIQALFFKIFGTNWLAYTIHPSIFNCVITVMTYHLFTKNKLSELKSFLFTLSFAILAYTISGTPFVDHHAVFFLLISTYLIISNIKENKNYIWVVVVIMIYLSFLSKQVPATYLAISYATILTFFLFKKKKFKELILILLSALILFIFSVILLITNGIGLQEFYVQYLAFPSSIGESRLENFDITLNSFFNHYKFILLPLIIIIILRIDKKNKKLKINLENKIIFLVLITFTIFLIFHQMITKNQIYIYFLIPILIAFAEIEMQHLKIEYKKILSIIMISLLVFVTTKYHIRFNESRKFHELVSVNLKNSILANQLHPSLQGLNWISSTFEGEPSDEMMILKKAIERFPTISEEIMLITHYQFLQSITNKKLNYPNKTHTVDGVSMPLKNNKYYNYYKKFILKKIKEKNVKNIYFFKHENLPKETITEYINENCYEVTEDDLFYIYKLNCFN